MNQKKMHEKYAKEQRFSNLSHYTDDGWSGTNFERPDRKHLLTDIEDGKIGCVVVKNMRRKYEKQKRLLSEKAEREAAQMVEIGATV